MALSENPGAEYDRLPGLENEADGIVDDSRSDVKDTLVDEIRKAFSGHGKFTTEIIDEKWCKWLLYQLGRTSFDEVSTISSQEVEFLPNKNKSFKDLLTYVKNIINRTAVLPVGVSFNEKYTKDLLECVVGGMDFNEALSTIISDEFDIDSAPKTLTEGKDAGVSFSLKAINQDWCKWVLTQLNKGSFDNSLIDSADKIFFLPAKKKTFGAVLGNIKMLIKRQGLLKKGIQFSEKNVINILQDVYEGKTFDEAFNLSVGQADSIKPEVIDTDIEIPDDLQKEFDKHIDFNLDVVTPNWCKWILKQMGKDSFSKTDAASTKKVVYFPGKTMKISSLFINIKFRATTNSLLKDGLRFEIHNVATILQHVLNGKNLQEAIDATDFEVDEQKAKAEKEQREKEIREQLKEDLIKLIKEIKEGNSHDARTIRKLIFIFGAEKFRDMLYFYHPRFKGLPVDYVKGAIGEYLGDFLVPYGTPDLPEDIEDIPELLPPGSEEVLFTIVKDRALAYCTEKKLSGSTKAELDLILEYLTERDQKLGAWPVFSKVVNMVMDYYADVFHNTHKPSHMVDCIKDGRQFPDLNQLVNINEIARLKKVLIADEMGLGKSNSAISAKEFLGLKKALILAPASVIDREGTWEDYLSDKVGKDGRQIGYFKPGQEPKSLVVKNAAQLRGEDLSEYKYVVISHEKLTDANVDLLLSEYDFDYLIVDEIHKLKNLKDGKRTHNLLRLTEKNDEKDGYLALLSGTPVPNKIKDLALILRLLDPKNTAAFTDNELILKMMNGDLAELRLNLHMRMQMKKLDSAIKLPYAEEHPPIRLDFTPVELDLYEALREEDELVASEKMLLLRRFCLNPSALEIAPPMPFTKTTYLNNMLNNLLQEEGRGKIIVFVNNIVDGIITNNKSSSPTILDQITLPEDVEVACIHGDNTKRGNETDEMRLSRKERRELEKRLNTNNGKRMVIFVSGQTADVGIAYTGAHHIIHLNEPWTVFDKEQQNRRVVRPGLEHEVGIWTIRMRGSFEEVQWEYMEKKYKAIYKLLHGIPLDKAEEEFIEKELEHGEEEEKIIEVNPELAREWESRIQRYGKFFTTFKEKGEDGMKRHLEKSPGQYAEIYEHLGTRSYHGNNVRVNSALLRGMIKERGQSMESLNVLDLASGPKMLEKHSLPDLASRVTSLDINPDHFDRVGYENAIVGSFLDIPMESCTLDYCVLGFAFDYTNFAPTKKMFERVRLLAEINRVLKVGGVAMISMAYSMKMKDIKLFEEAVETLGFKIVKSYTGVAKSESDYEANYITLEKVEDVQHLDDGKIDIDSIIGSFNNGVIKGLKFRTPKNNAERNESAKKQTKLSHQRRMIEGFTFSEFNAEDQDGEIESPVFDERKYSIEFNENDQRVKEEEDEFYGKVDALMKKYKCDNVKDIPSHAIIDANLGRYKAAKDTYRIYKKMETTAGIIKT